MIAHSYTSVPTRGSKLRARHGTLHVLVAVGVMTAPALALAVVASVAMLLLTPATASSAAQAPPSFVTRNGSSLVLDGARFRFSGANMYWLGLGENEPPGTTAYPTDFRIHDGIATAALMGARVVRCHTCGISTGNPLSFEPALGTFNDTALRSVDVAVAAAGAAGIHLVVPLTDNWHYYHGGKHDFTDWRGLPESAFYTNDTVIADFEDYISKLLGHVNTVSGVAFKDDATIMAWETGNELSSPPTAWTERIAQHIKSLAPRHLVLDGTHGVNAEALSLPGVDMYSDHFYPPDTSRMQSDAAEVQAANKVFYVGEYGWTSKSGFTAAQLADWTSAMVAAPGVSGDTYWSLFPHADDGGFVQHGDGFTLHFPGDTPDLATRVTTLRDHAFAMQGCASPPQVTVVDPPALLRAPASSSPDILWRGSAGSANYTVDRSTTSPSGPWTTVCDLCVDDNGAPWKDPTAPAAGYRYYRIRGNAAYGGAPGPWSTPTRRQPVPSARS